MSSETTSDSDSGTDSKQTDGDSASESVAKDESAVDELDGPAPPQPGEELPHKSSIENGPEPVDPLATDFAIGDPAIDLATGRSVVIVDHVANRTDDHSDHAGYDFLQNYGNSRLRAKPSDPIYEAVYVNSLQSKPSKSYDFPSSRLGRPKYENVDGVRRIYDRVALDVLKRLFATRDNPDDELELDSLESIARRAGLGASTIDEARELADVETSFGGSE